MLHMTTPEIIIRLLEAAALGALIGIEREVVHNHIDPDKQRSQAIFGGLRSYTLISLLGAISVYLGNAMEFTAGMVVFV